MDSQRSAEDELARRFVVATHGLFNGGAGVGGAGGEDRRRQYNRYLTEFVRTKEAWGVCCRVLQSGPSNLAAQLAPELVPWQDQVWVTSVLFASQSMQGMARRTKQLSHVTDMEGGLPGMEVFLRDALAAFAKPPPAAIAIAPRVRAQLFLAYGALAVRAWPPRDLIPGFSKVFGGVDLLQALRVLAELVGEDGLSLGRRTQEEIQGALAHTAPQVFESLASMGQEALAASAAEGPLYRADLLDAVLGCLSAWLALETVYIGTLADSPIVALVFDLVDCLARSAAEASVTVAFTGIASKLMESAFLLASRATLNLGSLERQKTASPDAHAAARQRLRERLLLEPLLHMLRVVGRSDSQDVELATNVCATLVTVAQAHLSVLGEHYAGEYPEHAFDGQIEIAVSAVTACMSRDAQIDVVGATFEFWYSCRQACEEIANLPRIPGHHASFLQDQWERAVAIYCTDLVVIPADDIYAEHWDANRRDDFRALRREFRNLLRTLFAGEEALHRFIGWVRSVVAAPEALPPWRLAESGLHALSAMAQNLPVQDDDIQVILERTALLVAGGGAPAHRALVRTAAVLAGAMSGPARDAPSGLVGHLFACARVSLYGQEEDEIFPMREASDHVGAVALAKLCASRSCALVLGDLELRGKGGQDHAGYLVEDVQRVFAASCAAIGSARATRGDLLIRADGDPSSTRLHLSLRSVDLVLQALCYFAFHCLCEDVGADTRVISAVTEPIGRLFQDNPSPSRLCHGFHHSMVTIGAANRLRDAHDLLAGKKNLELAHREFVKVLFPVFQLALRSIEDASGARTLTREDIEVLEVVFAFLTVFCVNALPVDTNELRVAIGSARVLALQGLERPSAAGPLAIQFLVSLTRRFEGSPPDHAVYGVLVDCSVDFVERASSAGALLRLVGADPETLRLVLQFARTALCCAALPHRVQDGPPSQNFVERRLFALHRAASDATITVLNGDASEIEDQDLALETVQLGRGLVLGACDDREDVFARPMPRMPAWFKATRDMSLGELRGARLVRGLLCAGGGRLPAWAIDRVALCLRALLGQFPDMARPWLEAALSEPCVPRAGASPTSKKDFLQKLEDVAGNAALFKRCLKQLCGGKRKGAKTQRPRTDGTQTGAAFVVAT